MSDCGLSKRSPACRPAAGARRPMGGWLTSATAAAQSFLRPATARALRRNGPALTGLIRSAAPTRQPVRRHWAATAAFSLRPAAGSAWRWSIRATASSADAAAGSSAGVCTIRCTARRGATVRRPRNTAAPCHSTERWCATVRPWPCTDHSGRGITTMAAGSRAGTGGRAHRVGATRARADRWIVAPSPQPAAG